jgi:drug/metabolite transporter (DMT)-like permease
LICVSCGLGIYLLPVVAIVLGVIGVMMAKNAVNPQRSQLWSWLGIGSGVVAVLLALFAFAVYIILIFGFVKGSGY